MSKWVRSGAVATLASCCRILKPGCRASVDNRRDTIKRTVDPHRKYAARISLACIDEGIGFVEAEPSIGAVGQ